MTGTARHLLTSRRFLPLFVTQFLGAFNDNAFKNAFLIWFTYDAAAASGMNAPMMVSLAAGLFILPFLLFSALAGQVADKYEKPWLAQKIKQVEILLMLAGAVGFYYQSVHGLLAVLFLMGVHSTFFGPIKYSLLPEHLKEYELVCGNGLVEGGTFLAILLGTIFGGLVIRLPGGPDIFSVCVIAFALLGWWSSRHIPSAPVGEPNLAIGWNMIRETGNMLRHVRQDRTVWRSVIGISWFWSVGAIFLTQFPIYTKTMIGGDERIVTLFLTVFSLGIGAGSMLCGRLMKGEIHGRLVPFGSLGMTLSILLFLAASYLYGENAVVMIGPSAFFATGLSSWLIIIGLWLLSVCAGLYVVPLYTIMQHRSDDRRLARTIAANNVLNALFMVLASIVTMAFFALGASVTGVFLAVALANLAMLHVVRGGQKI